LAIFAFSCACGYRGELSITQKHANGTVHSSHDTLKYPFDQGIEMTLSKDLGNKSVVILCSLPLFITRD